MKLDEIVHATIPIRGGGEVILLNTGAIIGPEAEAMLQALHSRSVGGLKNHLEVLSERGPENFMKNFYVGYGHKSIGDCGTITLFIEGVSMLAAKAIQDWPLYSGQEASTRYIDFKIQPLKNPLGTKDGTEILEAWRKFYQDAMEETKEYLKNKFPMQADEAGAIYDKAINARAFDALRGFLPSGATTNLAWHTNLRQAADKVVLLRHHPLQEVRDISEAIEKTLTVSYPNSFGHKRYEATENYNAMWMKDSYYHHDKNCPDFKLAKNNVDISLLDEKVLNDRPAKTELPKHLAEAGTLQFEFTLDFGSFRDIHRHRAVTQRMPLLTTELGFESWYLEEVPKSVKDRAAIFLEEQEEKIANLNTTKEIAQYYTAMGYKTANRLTGNLPALVYLVELRATRFVHPTLRKRALEISETLVKEFSKNGLKIHIDAEPDRFDVKRGEHDIVLK